MTNINPVYHDVLIEKVKKFTRHNILTRFYASSFFGCVVKFGRSVFDLFGRMVKNSAIHLDSAIWTSSLKSTLRIIQIILKKQWQESSLGYNKGT